MRKNKFKHPGERLDDVRKCILHLSKTKLAAALGIAPNTLYAVLKGKRRIDPKMAAKLGELHKDTAFWLEMQMRFDLRQAEQSHLSAGSRNVAEGCHPEKNGGGF